MNSNCEVKVIKNIIVDDNYSTGNTHFVFLPDRVMLESQERQVQR